MAVEERLDLTLRIYQEGVMVAHRLVSRETAAEQLLALVKEQISGDLFVPLVIRVDPVQRVTIQD
jgi:hypothetical protein